jgi:ADP-ribosylation factor-like protein 4
MELLRTVKQNEDVPLLVLANKQDLPGAKQPTELAAILGLNQQLLGHNSWHVCATCAINGEGLDEAIQILYQMIAKKRRQIKITKKHKNR